jgi:hypothetical protein
MDQLNLFTYFNCEVDEPKVILGVDKVDLSTLPKDPFRMNGKGQPYSVIQPNKYFVHKTGGYHFTDEQKIGKNDYPYVTLEKNNKVMVVKPHVSWSDPYPKIGVRINRENNTPTTMIIKMHRIVAYAFIKAHKNPKYFLVDHTDGDITNYRLDNLKWVDGSKNLTGRKVNKSKQMELANFLKKGR